VSYGPTDDNQSRRALRRAYELGITFYDTSDLYGFGHSECLLGEVFKDVRDRVVIASKVGFLGSYGPQDFSRAHIRRSIEKSLRRLRSDYLDLYQLHNPPVRLLKEDASIMETLLLLKREGKLRAIGISTRSPAEGLTAVADLAGVQVLQVNFNLVDQRALESGLFERCLQEGVGVICRTPLCFGFLTGKYASDSRFDTSDHRSVWSADQVKRWAEAAWMFETAVADRTRQTQAQVALRFCLSYAAVSTVIPGMLTSEQVEENVLASELGALSEIERREMERIYLQNTFFVSKR
jgi:aryl-alcohol dehydrogenase-like predicted oxidoreductase